MWEIGQDARMQLTEPYVHWSLRQDSHNTFLGLAAQCSLLPYIQAKIEADRRLPSQSPTKNSLGLFECAVFGFTARRSHSYLLTFMDAYEPLEQSMRLETVRYLLDQGVNPSGMTHEYDGALVRLEGRIQDLIKLKGNDADYYSEVAKYTSQRKRTKLGFWKRIQLSKSR
ncbi:hypothetical protein B0T25DRAFT_250558 [Lasiosphaeria hispida]|uniref:Uncharacterized protein n=1 Tax=Lasiosphaeria hispida TaxID=260671 RepID=A0AAJ0MCQ8_9PEZI|nr:hypothetical protein B0T25DRAFT_250558 [Lasiosphaeria hispida]